MLWLVALAIAMTSAIAQAAALAVIEWVYAVDDSSFIVRSWRRSSISCAISGALLALPSIIVEHLGFHWRVGHGATALAWLLSLGVYKAMHIHDIVDDVEYAIVGTVILFGMVAPMLIGMISTS